MLLAHYMPLIDGKALLTRNVYLCSSS